MAGDENDGRRRGDPVQRIEQRHAAPIREFEIGQYDVRHLPADSCRAPSTVGAAETVKPSARTNCVKAVSVSFVVVYEKCVWHLGRLSVAVAMDARHERDRPAIEAR